MDSDEFSTLKEKFEKEESSGESPTAVEQHVEVEEEEGEESKGRDEEEDVVKEVVVAEEGKFHFEDDEEGEEETEIVTEIILDDARSLPPPSESSRKSATKQRRGKQLDTKTDYIAEYLLDHLPGAPTLENLSIRAEKGVDELRKLPESLIPAGLIDVILELNNCVEIYRKAHDLCIERNNTQTALILGQEAELAALKEELETSKGALVSKDKDLESFVKKLDAYHLREHELQEEIEIQINEIKHLHEEIKRRDDIQADIDEEIGTSGRAREAYARQKQKLKDQMDAVQQTLGEMKEERDKVIDLHKGAVVQIEELRKEIVAKNDLLIHREKILAKVDFERNDMKRTLYGTKQIFKLIHDTFKDFEEHIISLEKANFTQASQIDGLLRKTIQIFKQNIFYANETAKSRTKIDTLLKAYSKLFLYLQAQERKLRIQLLKVHDFESKLAILNRKHSKSLMEKKKAIQERDTVICEHQLYERALKQKEVEIENYNKKFQVLISEQGRLQIVIGKLKEQKVKALRKVDDSLVNLSSAKIEQVVQNDEIATLNRTIDNYKTVKKRLLLDNTTLMQKIEESTEEIRLARAEHYAAQKSIMELEKQYKHLMKQTNTLIKEKNILHSKYIECKQVSAGLELRTSFPIRVSMFVDTRYN